MRRLILLAMGLSALTACAPDSNSPSTTTTLPQTTSTTTGVTTTTSGTTSTSSTSSSTIPDDADHEFSIEGFAFSGPDTAEVGESVLVTNRDSFPHTWTSTEGGWSSGTLTPGGQFFHVFERAGTFEFFCGIHAEMRGSITVEG